MKTFRAAAAVLMLLACLTATGCASIFNASEEEALTPTPVPMEMVPQAGGDLFIAIPEDISSFDPITATNEDLINFLTLIYETPFSYSESGMLQNCLISNWDVNEARTTYTFRLRDDVYFSDGEPLTAQDVVASAKRVLGRTTSLQAEPEEESPPGPEDGEETPVTWQSNLNNRYAAYNHDILSIDAENEHEVTVTLTEGGNAALHFMTFPVTKADFRPRDVPVGTGPYRVDSYTAGEQAVLTINELWWQERPYIDRIVANAVSRPSQKMEKLATSILDFVTTDAVNSSNYNVTGQWQVIDYMTDYYDCIVPNLQHPALRKVQVRQALSAALDRRELLSTVLLNHGVPSLLPIAPDYYAVDARYRSGQSSPSEALELLEAAGYRTEDSEEAPGQILHLKLIVPDTIESTYKREAARAIGKQLERVFVEIEVAELSVDDYMTALQGGDFDLAYCSYYLSEVPNLAFMFDVNGAGNYGHVDDPELAEAIQACRRAVTEEEVVEACTVMQERLSSLLPQIGLYFRMNSIICDEGIHGIHEVRQNSIFATVSSWFNSYFAQTVQQTATPTAAESTGQTLPDSLLESAAPSGSSSASHPGASRSAAPAASRTGGPAPDPTEPGSQSGMPTGTGGPAPDPTEPGSAREDLSTGTAEFE